MNAKDMIHAQNWNIKCDAEIKRVMHNYCSELQLDLSIKCSICNVKTKLKRRILVQWVSDADAEVITCKMAIDYQIWNLK